MVRRQGRYWIATIPISDWTPQLPESTAYIHGQQELGSTTGYRHYQLFIITKQKSSIRQLRLWYTARGHFELTRSDAAESYCLKDDTAIPGTRFELGVKPFNRSSTVDWDRIWNSAKIGDFDAIPPDIRLRNYRTLRTIASDYSRPVAMDRTCAVFWGDTHTGKSHKAWTDFPDAYPKIPTSKWWDGYRGQSACIMDEFRGQISIEHLLRWTDRYPCSVEIKGGSVPLCVRQFVITSNLSPRQWYPDADETTIQALLRRLTVTHFTNFFSQ